MRTNEEIHARIEKVKTTDIFGFGLADLVYVLPWDEAKRYMKDDSDPSIFEENHESRDPAAVKRRMQDYMMFAWDKANNRRGISAWRSLMHMSVWLWLLGEDEVADSFEDYTHYGKPQLRAICEHFGWDWREYDDDRWATEEMYEGVPADAIERIELPWKGKGE